MQQTSPALFFLPDLSSFSVFEEVLCKLQVELFVVIVFPPVPLNLDGVFTQGQVSSAVPKHPVKGLYFQY